MSDKKVKISNILGSQIPDFIQVDNPLFKEFLTQYYASEEREYGTTYLADNIASLKKISTVSDISLVEKQTIPAPSSTTPESNDIVAKENLYIVLDTTGNSKLNLLEDVLVSGSNISGTNYTPPSSFISNKKYTR